MKEKTIFLFFCMVFVAKVGFSKTPCQLTDTFQLPLPLTLSDKRFVASSIITPNLAVQQGITDSWGWFCRKEWAWEKKTGLPFKFRLGSVEYCNWMEGKINYRRYR